jgi:hypothetical protein
VGEVVTAGGDTECIAERRSGTGRLERCEVGELDMWKVQRGQGSGE